MGILDFIKGELIDIIEWTDDSRDTLSYRFPDMTESPACTGLVATTAFSAIAWKTTRGSIVQAFLGKEI